MKYNLKGKRDLQGPKSVGGKSEQDARCNVLEFENV
jgi:hypothetical protein